MARHWELPDEQGAHREAPVTEYLCAFWFARNWRWVELGETQAERLGWWCPEHGDVTVLVPEMVMACRWPRGAPRVGPIGKPLRDQSTVTNVERPRQATLFGLEAA